jgi:16S rRNA (cytidine1402-2'-O)-methyltransferase
VVSEAIPCAADTPVAAAGRLLVCPTPIGNLEDVTLRVLAALRAADVIACEDTRRTGRLLERHGVQGRLLSYHEHNERARTEQLVARMRAGETVALVSDAGMPLISDPGLVLVRACIAAGLQVEVLPGPSAALCALVASGLASERWRFVGFLPRHGAALTAALAVPETVVAFESPRRLAATLQALSERDPDRQVAVCRELTKLHEEVVRGTAAVLAQRYAAEEPLGEIVLVLGPASAEAVDLQRPLEAVARLIEGGTRPRVAAGVVAELTGTSANELYRSHLARRA